jgi:phage-related protein
VAKALRILHGEIKTPPMSVGARREAGFLLRQLQEGIVLSLPASRPMPEIESKCHELRVKDASHDWRIVFAVERDAVLILEVFEKSSKKTPRQVMEVCRRRVREYRRLIREEE